MNRWLAVLVVLAIAVPAVSAKDIGKCKLNVTQRQMVDEMNRTMKACVTTMDTLSECGRASIDVQEFHNNEGLLPRIKSKESAAYIEGKLRQSDGSAGTWRVVDKFDMSGKKSRFLEAYYTGDHYATFCIL